MLIGDWISQSAILVVDENLQVCGKASFPGNTNAIHPQEYYLELNVFPDFNDNAANYYQNLIGMFR